MSIPDSDSTDPFQPMSGGRHDYHRGEPKLVTRTRYADRDVPARAQPPGRAKGFGRRLIAGLMTLFIVACFAALALVTWLRHKMHAALPQVDGQVQVRGVSAEVRVTRDAHGVPSIYAQSVDDVLAAQGYVTAQDRLWQMDALRRHGAGTLAEILGPGLVRHDTQQRILQLNEAAQRAVDALPSDQRHQLEMYALGVNSFINSHQDQLPVEFAALHYKPAPWQPRDSLLVVLTMWQELANSFPTKMAREVLQAHLPLALIGDLYPVGSWRDRPPGESQPDLTSEHPEIEQIPLDRTQSRADEPALPFASPQLIARVAAAIGESDCPECRAGSNNWAVSGARSASGAPLVSNDMHLGLSAPDIWYEAALHAPAGNEAPAGLDIAGFTLPGLPFIIVGRNAHVAWGVTAMGGDVQDVRIEHTRGEGEAMEYQRPDTSWARVTHHAEHIIVRGGHDVTLDVLATESLIGTSMIPTPIISTMFPGEKRILSLAWTAYDPRSLEIPALAMDTARDGASLVAAMADFGGPTLSAVWGDDRGHIGYHALGRIPVRGPAMQHPLALSLPMAPLQQQGSAGVLPSDEETEASASDGRSAPPPAKTGASPEFVSPRPQINYTIGSPVAYIPVDALDLSQAWSGYVPYDKLPAVVDPASGVLATANARVTPSDYPYFLTSDWGDAYRVERINNLLQTRSGLTPADMLAIENDDASDLDRTLAQKLAYAIDHAKPGRKSERMTQAADLLRRWDGNMDPDSPAAAIALATRDALWPLLLVGPIAAHNHLKPDSAATQDLIKLYVWGERTTALEEIITHQPARWLPNGFANWSDFLSETVLHAVDNAGAPRNLTRWKLASYRPTEIAHPVFGSRGPMSHVLGVATGSGAQPVRGDGLTVRAAGLHFGPSERFDADMKDSDTTLANITTGESGNPASEWYLDQFVPWLIGKSFVMPLVHPEAAHTLTLVP